VTATLIFTIAMSGVARGGPITVVQDFESVAGDSFILHLRHGPVDQDDSHAFNLQGKWLKNIFIQEIDRVQVDSVGVALSFPGGGEQGQPAVLRHLVGVDAPGHPNESANPAGFEFTLFVVEGILPNNPDSKEGTGLHPPNVNHIDSFSATLTATFGGFFGSGITGYDLELRGTHSVPEPSTIVLVGTGVLAIFGSAWRRRNRKTQP
jgi:hypothetical protein